MCCQAAVCSLHPSARVCEGCSSALSYCWGPTMKLWRRQTTRNHSSQLEDEHILLGHTASTCVCLGQLLSVAHIVIGCPVIAMNLMHFGQTAASLLSFTDNFSFPLRFYFTKVYRFTSAGRVLVSYLIRWDNFGESEPRRTFLPGTSIVVTLSGVSRKSTFPLWKVLL